MKNTLISITTALMAMMPSTNMSAAAIEHIGDRIIINVEEMDLKGDESLLDIVMSMPECMSTDGRDTYSDDMFGYWAIRIDNLDICVDTESFLKNTKARDLKRIKLCMNPGVMKGCGNMKKILDVNFRTPEDGTHGSINIEGGSYGNGASYNTVNYQHDNLNIKGWLIGNLGYSKEYGTGICSNTARQDAKMQMVWDATPKDNIEFNINQSVNRSHVASAGVGSSQDFEGNFIYTHSFDNGGYGLLEFDAFYDNINGSNDSHSREFYPDFNVEFSMPFLSNNLWLTPGIESGYSYIKDVVGKVTNRQRYEDFYLQADWTLKKFHLMIGDRYRFITYWNNNDAWEHTWSNHYYTFSAWVDINDHNILQGTFAHRFFAPDNETFNIRNNNDEIVNYDYEGVYKPDCYVSELRYTFQQKDITIMSLLQNVHQQFEHGVRAKTGNDNCLSFGMSANWKVCDCFRLTLGVNYNWERYNNETKNYIKHNNFVNLRLIPEVTVSGWRFITTMLYNSRRSNDEDFAYYTMPNFYAALRVSKDITQNWNIYIDAHDLADQRTGNREAILGVTYKW